MRVKLIVSPVKYGGSHPLLPPIGVALISNHLRQNSYTVDQDDIDIKVCRDNESGIPDNSVNLEWFDDHHSVDSFLKGTGDNSYVRLLSERMLDKTTHNGFDFFGFSILWDRSYAASSTTLAMAKLVKEKYDVPVVVGAYSFEQARNFIETGYVDYCIIGPGEEAMLKLCSMIEDKTPSPGTVKGLIYRKGDSIVQNEGGYPNVCKFPDFKGLPLDLYKFSLGKDVAALAGVPPRKEVLVLPYYFSIGCHSNCIFCSQSKSKLFEVKPVKTVVSEVRSLLETYKTPYLYFLNTNVNISKKYANNLFDELENANVNIFWTDSINFEETDTELLEKMRRNGATRLIYGLESPNQARLDYIRKRLKLDHAVNVLQKSHELGIWNEVYLITGLPYETEHEVTNTAKFLKVNQEYINFVHLSSFRMMDSELLSNPQAYGIENIRFIASENKKYCDFYTYSYDEIDGRKWHDKAEQAEAAFNRISEAFRSVTTPFGSKYTSSNIHLLFYLHRELEKKKDIEEAYISIMNKCRSLQ